MASVFNAYLAYQFIKILTTPWEETEAYKNGVVDASGKQLKKSGDLKTDAEKKSFTIFHKIIFNLKRILSKFPGGKSRIASYAAAMALLKENNENLKEEDLNLLENLLIDYINKKEEELYESGILTEEMGSGGIANSVGDGSKLGNFINNPYKFSGMQIFKVDPDSFDKFMKGKKKYSRWDNFIRREDALHIRKYIKNNPTKRVVLQDSQNGSMIILHRDL